jgi:translation initiation factor 1 (eIF-1/SUI1)
MPKRSKKQGQAKGEDDHEGRPPTLTLASFIQFPDLSSSASSSIEKKNPEEANDEKEDSQISETLSQGIVSHSDNCLPIATEAGFTTTKTLNPIYFIGKTKKGKLPLTCESRAKGKKVTVISNVSGNAGALLSELKRKAGCGGVIREGTVELQGDRLKFLSQFLTGHPCLKPYKI